MATSARLRFDASAARVAEGRELLACGVGSDFRLGMSPHPLVIREGQGPYLVDADGNRLIDYYLGMGPMILGHSPEPVIEAVRRQMDQGLLFGAQSEVEYAAAQRVRDLVPCAERVRFGSSGSEVVQAALRIARFTTGRTTVVKFEGHYHGWFDNILWSTAPPLDRAGDARAPERVAGSAGMDTAAGDSIDVLPWNDLALLEERLQRGDVAAVIMEPAMCNSAAAAPLPGYLEGVRAACTRTGTVLIFDEVITGFRLSAGGAQALFGVTPDLATFAKALAAGFPVSALAGRRDLMETLGGAAGGSVVHAGTYNGQAPMMAAVVATLDVIADPATHDHLTRVGTRLKDGIDGILSARGIPHRVQGWPAIFHVALGVDSDIRSYRDAARADRPRYVRFCSELLSRGVRALERGAWFVSTAHDDALIDRTLEAVDEAAAAVA